MTGSPKLTADEAMQQAVSLGRAVIAALGTKPWKLIVGPDAEACKLSDGTTGLYVSWAANGPGSTDRSADARIAETELRKHGMTVQVQRVPGGDVREVGRSDWFGSMEFDAGQKVTGVTTSSVCVPGNAEDYRSHPAEEPIPSASAS